MRGESCEIKETLTKEDRSGEEVYQVNRDLAKQTPGGLKAVLLTSGKRDLPTRRHENRKISELGQSRPVTSSLGEGLMPGRKTII